MEGGSNLSGYCLSLKEELGESGFICMCSKISLPSDPQNSNSFTAASTGNLFYQDMILYIDNFCRDKTVYYA